MNDNDLLRMARAVMPTLGLELDIHADVAEVRAGLLRMMRLAMGMEREACAKLCEEVITRPAGYGGQWEGYGPVKTQRSGTECAAVIRSRSTPCS